MNNIPKVTKILLIANIAVFLITILCGQNVNIIDGKPEYTYILNDNYLGLHFFLAPNFHIYQLLTYMFAHGGWSHLFFNMFALWMFGCIVERTWGPQKFLFYYIVCGIGAGLFQELAQFCQFYILATDYIPQLHLSQIMLAAQNCTNGWTTVGASGAIYGILLAFGMLYPEERMFIFPLPVPIKAKWFVVGYAAIELFMAFSTSGDGVAHVAHLGGMVFGYFLIRYWRKNPGMAYNRRGGQSFFDSLRQQWERRSHKQAGGSGNSYSRSGGNADARHETDWQYNARRKAEQEEIDRILDKIRRSGYDSLTREEKIKLFENSRK